MLYIARDSDNFHPWIIFEWARDAHASADGFFVGPISPGKCFVNNNYGPRIRFVLIRKLTSPQYGNTHRQKIIGRTDAISTDVILAWRRFRLAFNQKGVRGIAATEGQIIYRTGRLYTGQSLNAF